MAATAEQPGNAREPEAWTGNVKKPWWAHYAKHALIAGLAASLVLHLIGGILATLIYFAGPGGKGPGHDGGSAGGGVQMAIMTEGELAALGGTTGDDASLTTITATPTDAIATETTLGGPPGDNLAGDVGAEVGGGLGGGGDIAGGGPGLGGGPGGTGSGAGGGTNFFGVEARGERIAFIVDVSGSMIGDRLEELKSQLTSAIQEMTETSSFVVYPFSSASEPLGGKSEWTEASVKNKAWASRLVAGLVADGGTEPIYGFELLFKMRPRPDVVFFMTDGAFDQDGSDKTLNFIMQSNRSPRVKIHCICFEENSSEVRMRQIAKQSGGSYNFVARKPR